MTDHIATGHETHPDEFERMEIMQCLSLDHNGIKLESMTNMTGKIPKYLEIKQHTSEQHMDQRGTLERNEKYFELNKNGKTVYLNVWDLQQKQCLQGSLCH